MSAPDAVTTFFDLWGETDAGAQAAGITEVYAADGTYADPRSGAVLTGPSAIAAYVAQFAANAPGWQARIVAAAQTLDRWRITVAFGGKGPDGTELVQHGQYFAALAGGKIADMVGFAGMGTPE